MSTNPDGANQAVPEVAIPLMLRAFADLVSQLDARFDALKTVVCELHPEVADRLEDLIRKNILANKNEVERQEKMQALLRSIGSGPLQ